MDSQKIADLLQGAISNTEETKQSYSHDASIFAVTPEAVIFPKNTTDISKLVTFINDEKPHDPNLSITVRAAGTCMTGGPLNDSLILDITKHLNTAEPITDNAIWVEPGMFYKDFEKVTLAKNLLMPTYPSSREQAAIGGMVGNNAGGEKSLAYGQTRDFVEAVKIILSDGKEYEFGPLTQSQVEDKCEQTDYEGQIYRTIWQLVTKQKNIIEHAKPTTSKNSAGYAIWDVWDGKFFNLAKLFTGSQGTLGILTKIKLNLITPKTHKRMLLVELDDFVGVGRIINSIKTHEPECFELFDEHTLKLALRYLPEIALHTGKKGISLYLQFLPELLKKLFHRLPKLILIAEFTGNTDSEAEHAAEAAKRQLKDSFQIDAEVLNNPDTQNKYWAVRRESYNLLRKHNPGLKAACFIEDICVHPEDLPTFLPELYQIFAKYPHLTYTVAGHAGDANFHIMPLMDLRQEKNRNDILEISAEVFALVQKYRGTITAEHNDGIVRGPFLPVMFTPEALAIFKQIKNLFDPGRIFNPHKKIDADFQFYKTHLRHD